MCECTANIFPGTKHVEGVGPLNAKIMLLGEAPGADEDQTGVPFVGGAGRILSAWLASSRISRDSCYIDNVIQHRPPNNNIDLVDLGAAIPSLYQRILRVRPNLIMCLGNTSLQCFTNGTIGLWRGGRFPTTIGGQEFQTFATYHPSFIMRQKKMWDVVVHDFVVAKRFSQNFGYSEDTHYILHPTSNEIKECVF